MAGFFRHTQLADGTRRDAARRSRHGARLVAVLAGALAGVVLATPQTQGELHDSEVRASGGQGAEQDATPAPTDGSSRGESGEGSVAPLRFSNAWVRAMPPGRDMTAAYLTVANPTDGAITIRSVQASRGTASLHENRRVDGQVQMRALATLTLPAHGEAILAPGGLHIMLMDLDRTPVVGETLRLCLASTAGSACLDAPVLRRAPDPSSADAGHRH